MTETTIKHPKSDHFAFQVSDLDRAIVFYTDRLGFKLMFSKLDEEHHEAFAFFELEGGNLEILQVLDEINQPVAVPKKEIEPPYCPHFALSVEDLDGLMKELAEKGVPIVKGPMEIAGQVRWLYVADPDNNVLEFVQWL